MAERAGPSVPHDSSSSSSSGGVLRRSDVSISSAEFFMFRERTRDEGAMSGCDAEDDGYS